VIFIMATDPPPEIDQIPPKVASDKEVVEPTQMLAGPTIAAGVGLTVKLMEVLQPPVA
jgi:hypothetical protein